MHKYTQTQVSTLLPTYHLYKEKTCPSVSTFISPSYHTGAYLNRQTAVSHTLWLVVTHTHTHTPIHRSHKPGVPPFPFNIHNHHSLCKTNTHHILSAWVHWITHAPLHTRMLSPTHKAALCWGTLALLTRHLVVPFSAAFLLAAA